ncbi:hypothetical protein KSD_75140 [Ktedonobacter sp. SOSP1-85]|uniref:hypothetical protein n=1 Tax=Ktedonobacter sp. SOSP1-85 TaxID=2778367 RepID=UPI0019160822|nr:hypothetical protein [Ktedonobacter sp. SOSP1-85]GHO79743.1 hypothetical protein KSD_75140 [Ktedonobacter sp. SOSP1-85]
MLLQPTIFICSLFISAIIGCLIGYSGFRERKRTLFEEGSKLYTQQIPFGAYCRYAEVRKKSISTIHGRVRSAWPFFLFPAAILIWLIDWITRQDFVTSHRELTALPALIGVIGGIWIMEIITDIKLDLPALRIFLDSQFERSRFITCDIRQMLFAFLSWFLILLIGGMYLSIYSAKLSLFKSLFPLHVVSVTIGNIGNLPWLITLVVFLVLLRLFLNIFALQYARLTASLQPLEHTQWASLAPRILAWCQLTGVEFASVMVAQDLINRQAIRLAGLGHRPTLIISEALLRTGEWRQYDTFICQAIAIYKRLEPQKQLMRDILALSILIAWIAIAPITVMFPASPARDIICDILFIGLGIAGIAVHTLLSVKNIHATDDFVIKLTGDPLALITVHHVLAALNGEPIKPITNDATTKNDRMQRLVEKGNALWPRAPYAGTPIPSPLKVEINNYPITAPLNQATLPAPVPKVTYGNLAS